jgi:hypothetical protein
MFGLMRERSCNLPDEEKLRRRLDYCGTCKTLGRLYGHASRALLNHDTVFLAEVLAAISDPDAPVDEPDRAYLSYNCLALPESEDSAPAALAYAASVTILLAEAKIADHCADAPGVGWTVARRALSGRARAAAARLETWGFPLAEFWGWMESQRLMEAGVESGTRRDGDALDFLAEPTAAATAITLAHGARLAGRPDLAEDAGRLGHAFGRLVYLLDAFGDFERDARRGEFNAFRSGYGIDASELHGADRARAVVRIRADEAAVERAISALPMPSERTARFVARLRANVFRELREPLPISQEHRCSRRTWPSLRVRLRSARALGGSLAARHVERQPSSRRRSAERPIVFASAAVVAFLFPAHAAAAGSYRECLDIGLNLMALGALASAVATSVRRVSLPDALRKKRKPQQEGSAETGGTDCCCEGCEDCVCCCDCSGGCGSCDCGGCDCCDCKCD